MLFSFFVQTFLIFFAKQQLYLQLRYHAHLSRIEDVGAFLDTAQAAAFASAVLLCVTLALNALALCAAAVCARKAADRA